MGRKAGGKNFQNFNKGKEEKKQPINILETDKEMLLKNFTHFDKDFISIQDFMADSGLSYEMCARIIREIKSISDAFGISGCIHRMDYGAYLSFRFSAIKETQCTDCANIAAN